MNVALEPHSTLRVRQAPLIYLAGPIHGCTEDEAKDWRNYVNGKLTPHNIEGVSPLRCEPLIGERYDLSYPDPCFGTGRAILAKNFLDLNRCDATLAYFPKTTGQRSMGTLGEVAWAYALRKPLIVVSDDELIRAHPFTACQPSWEVLDTLDDAVRLIVGIYSAYAGVQS